MSPTHTAIPVAQRISRFSYAIRNIAVEAERVEAAGMKVRYLNVGNPPAFGFQPAAHLIAAVESALERGENGYGPSVGVRPAREAVAAEYTGRGWPVSADLIVLITAGTSEAIELTLSTLVDPDGEVLVPLPTYPLYTAVLAKIGARAVFYNTDPSRGWLPDLDHLATLVTPATRALVVIDPNNPTGATYPVASRRGLLNFADRHGLVVLADEVYGDLGYDGSVPPLGTLDPDAPIISFSSLSKGYVVPGWRTGWLAVGHTPRLDDALAAIRKMADGRLCSVTVRDGRTLLLAALTGDRSHQQVAFRAALKERAAITKCRKTCARCRASHAASPRQPST